MPWSLEKKLPVFLIIVSLMLAAIGFLSFKSTESLESAVGWQKHTQEVLLKLDELMIAIVDVETSSRGFVIAGRESFLDPYNSGMTRSRRALEDLRALTGDNPNHQENYNRLLTVVDEKLKGMDGNIERRRTEGLLGAALQVSQGDGDAKMREIREIVQRMRDEEDRLLKIREANLAETLNGNYWMMIGGSVAGLTALILANFVVLFEIRKRRGAEANLVAANVGLEKRVEERTAELERANLQLSESELFRRSVIDSLSAHIAVLDRDGRIILVNEAWENFAASNAAAETPARIGVDENYLEVCENANEPEMVAVGEKLREALAGENTGFAIEYPCHSADERRWFLMQVNPLQGQEGGVVVSHYNITDRVEAENNEKVARREAEIANRLRDEFMATVSHELRTPLNAILGWARILQSGRLEVEKQGRAVETIIKNAETQNRLINDLMEVARLISGKLALETRSLRPADVIATSVETIRPAAAEKKISVTFNASPEASALRINGDTDRLRQVFSNLLTNAVKFTPENGHVDVSLVAENGNALVRVKDDGAGISEEFLPFVFERFRQDSAMIQKGGGLGLGLAIVRQLTELHGGEVSVESEGQGKGATFSVRLPIAAAD